MQIERFVFQSLDNGKEHLSMTSMSIADLMPQEQTAEPIAEIPAEPTVLLSEVERQKQEAYANGFRDAMHEAEVKAKNEEARVEQSILAVLTTLGDKLTLVQAEHRKSLSEKQAELANIALAVAKKVAGSALKHDAISGIEDMVKQCLNVMVGESKISVTVHPQIHLQLQKRINTLVSECGFEGELLINADETMSKEDCKVDWKHGGAERSTAQIWAEIENVINQTKFIETHESSDQQTTEDSKPIYLANR